MGVTIFRVNDPVQRVATQIRAGKSGRRNDGDLPGERFKTCLVRGGLNAGAATIDLTRDHQ